jgi:hypothetical protein
MKKKRLTFLDNFGFPDENSFFLERMNWIYEKNKRKTKKEFLPKREDVELGYQLRIII